MKIFRYILFLSILALAACKSSEPKNPGDGPDPIPNPDKTPRTVLVYMVAGNSLGSGRYDSADIEEMQQAAKEGQLGNGRLLIYHSTSKGAPMLKEITSEGVDTLKVYDDIELSVKIETMRRVFDDMRELAPAEDYGLVLWSHALGWLQDGIEDEDDVRTPGMLYSFGQEKTSKKMNITALAKALDGQGFSFVYMDCCFMGSVEVMYELRHAAPVFVASPAEGHICGMPYHKNLKYLFADKPDMAGAAKSTFDYYNETYRKGECPITWSAISTAGLEELAQATRRIYSLSPTPFPEGYSPQMLAESRLCYYYDFADYIEALCEQPELAELKAELLADYNAALAKTVLYAEHSPWIWDTIPLDHCCGLTTYILKTAEMSATKGYDQLSWHADVASALFPEEEPAEQ